LPDIFQVQLRARRAGTKMNRVPSPCAAEKPHATDRYAADREGPFAKASRVVAPWADGGTENGFRLDTIVP